MLIAPEGDNTRGIWRPPCCDHQRSGCCPHHNRLEIEAYLWSILSDGCKYQEWQAISKVHPSSRGDIAPPLGRGYHSAPEVVRSAGVALTGTVVAVSLFIAIFWSFSVISPHRWVQPLLWIASLLLNYLDKRSYYHHRSSLFLLHHNGLFPP